MLSIQELLTELRRLALDLTEIRRLADLDFQIERLNRLIEEADE